jgi:anti-sigma regulatory factor (Ser/Thr protein kinase)
VSTTHPPRRCALELEALPSRVAQVRRIVTAQLRYWNLDQFRDPALLAISELLANVHRHAEPDKHCVVELSFMDGLLTISVADHDPRPPAAGVCADLLDTSGRGMAILDALADRWGTRPAADGPGKVVWLALCGPPSAAEPLAAEAATAAEPAVRDASPAPAEPVPTRPPAEPTAAAPPPDEAGQPDPATPATPTPATPATPAPTAALATPPAPTPTGAPAPVAVQLA